MHVKLVVRSRGNSHVARLYSRVGYQECIFTSQTFRTKQEARDAAIAQVNANRYKVVEEV